MWQAQYGWALEAHSKGNKTVHTFTGLLIVKEAKAIKSS